MSFFRAPDVVSSTPSTFLNESSIQKAKDELKQIEEKINKIKLEREGLKKQFDEKNADTIKKIEETLKDMRLKCNAVSGGYIQGDESALTYKKPDFEAMYTFDYLSGKNNTLEKLHQEIKKKWPEYLNLLSSIPYAATRYFYSDLLEYFRKVFDGRDIYLDDHPASKLNEEKARLEKEKEKIEKQIAEHMQEVRAEAARQQEAKKLQEIKEMEEKLGFDSLIKNIDKEKIKVQKEICAVIVQCKHLHNAPNKFNKANLESFIKSNVQDPNAIYNVFVAQHYGIGSSHGSYLLGQKRDHYGWGEVVKSNPQLISLVGKLEAWDALAETLKAKSTAPEKRLELFKNTLKKVEDILKISFDQLNHQEAAPAHRHRF